MKSSLLAACVLALSAGCQKKEAPVPPVVVAHAPPRAPAQLPAPGPQPLTAAEPLGAATVSIAPRDGGTPEAAADPEPLALEHQHPGSAHHLQRCRDLRDQGELEGALTEARRALFDSPEDEDALAQIARLGQLTHHLDFAARAFEQLSELHPQDATPLIAQARIELAMEEYDRAIEAGNEAIRRDAQSAEAFAVTGRAHLAGGDLQGAIDLLEQAVELAPDHGYVLNNLGFALLRASRNEEAVDALSRAAERLPNVGFVHNNLGVALERTGKVEQAQAAYERASILSPRYLKAHLNAERLRRLASAQPVDADALELPEGAQAPQGMATDAPGGDLPAPELEP